MELQIARELAEKLNRLALLRGQPPDKLALDLLREWIEYNRWFAEEVEKGRADARDGRLLDHEDVVSRMGKGYPR